MSISGNISTMALSELLQWLSHGKKTGSLIIERPGMAKSIYFLDGRICASASSCPHEYLGHFLVSHGFVTEVELTKALDMQEATRMMLGKILVTIGALTEEEMRELLILKTEECVYDLFSWEEGAFRFVDNETLPGGTVEISLEVTGLILQGMNRIDEWRRIRDVIPSALAIPVAIGFLGEDSSPADQSILALVDDNRTIQEICHEVRASEFQVSRALFRQLEKGRVKIVVPREGPPSTPPSLLVPSVPPASVGSVSSAGDPSSPAQLPIMPVINAETLMSAAESHLEEGAFTRALRHLRAAYSLEPDNKKVQETYREAAAHIQAALAEDGLDLSAVPVLEREIHELTQLPLSTEEGFLLSRLDGSHTIANLIKISSMDQLDAQLVFHKLLKEGHIRLEAKSQASTRAAV